MHETEISAREALHSLHFCMFGAGSIAEAIVRGMLAQQLTKSERISIINRSNDERLQELQHKYNVVIKLNPQGKHELLHNADVIILCVKPKDAVGALYELKMMRSGALIISVIAGLSLQVIECILGPIAVVRAMPNTSSMIGLSATALCYSKSVSETQRKIAMTLFKTIGIFVEVEEQQMNIVTGLSGSGPAYLYYVMEAMMEAALEGGLTPKHAKELTVQTVLGTAEMVRLTAEEPTELLRKVTSPNGTTQAALDVMNNYQMGRVIRLAVHRAAERSLEIEQQIKKDIERTEL